MTDNLLELGSLTKRSEFLHVRNGRYAARGTVVIQMRPCESAGSGVRAGFTATKKIGGAVVRNRAKRRLRALARAFLPALGVAGHDYVFIARMETASAPHERLMHDVQKALEKLRAGGHKPRETRNS
ncbi:ribonuclease P protein component [Robiginitomaculum antarcticum]|uniref:ribonuclease P protein component n=1 Tax=Robiginitomaculum antarcticum TaxID=437507 RepID=UPI000361F34C|nr:ribonuclease P protein component [Robiginitomaculum antarcticum]